MIKDVNLTKCGYFKSDSSMIPNTFNLFIGSNGSGKTRLLRYIHNNLTHEIQQEQQQQIQQLQQQLQQKIQILQREQQRELRQKQQKAQQELGLLQHEHQLKQQELKKLQQMDKFEQLQQQQQLEQQQKQQKAQQGQRALQVLQQEEVQRLVQEQQQKQQERKLNIFPIFIDENRFYDGKLNYVKGRVELNNITNTTNIAPKTEEKNQLNDDLAHLFKRKIEIITDRNGEQAPHFIKNNGDVLTKDDGRGIVNVWTVFEYLAFAPDKLPLFIEELSIGLHPSLLKKYLDRLFMRLSDKKMQLFATTQDPFTAFYFLKNKTDEYGNWTDINKEYSVFNFSENDGILNVEKITEKNIFSSMNNLMGDFNGDPDLSKFNTFFSKH